MKDKATPVDLLALNESLQRILDAVHHDPFEVLGRHEEDGVATLRLFLPKVEAAWVGDLELQRIPGSDFFVWHGEASLLPWRCEVRVEEKGGAERTFFDPYCFPPQIGDFDLHLFGEGGHWHAYRWLGANNWEVDGVGGTMFAVWAPNADRVSVVGDFNAWDGRVHPMRTRGGSGIWELFLPGVKEGALYKFEIRGRDGSVRTKIDPYARWFQKRPETACVVTASPRYPWGDGKWMERRRNGDWQHAPMSIYEVHLGSWRRSSDNGFLNYRELAHQLAEYVGELGFTHIELLPVTEHPLDASWGYQTTGYFAPTSRFGAPDDFRYFVDYLHRQGIGVILDWVPAHFPKDDFALGRFDGTALYEHEDPRLGEHRDWGTLIFNYGRAEVKNFLLSSAVYWLEEFHLDGLRVDAVASMLYLDYSRQPGEWVPNRYGGRENIEAMEFLRHLNQVTHDQFPGTLTIAEESTAWPMVSRPTWVGGLGFSMKWDMGWMHDTLDYFAKDPIHRHFHHDRLTFGMLYHFTENFVLPFSHDEVVHGKRSMLDKMPGDAWQRFASLRLLYSYLFTYPGKKLLFMGSEFGQGREWNEGGQLDWYLLDRPQHQGVRGLVSELNRLYRERPALHDREFEHAGFDWVDCHDASQSVITYLRRGRDGSFSIVALNFTPVVRRDYRIGVPEAATYLERFNSDAAAFGGSNVSNPGDIQVEGIPWMNYGQSVTLTLPPLGAIVLEPN